MALTVRKIHNRIHGAHMTDSTSSFTDRRTFLKQATTTALGAGLSARSYGRVLGANDRIALAQLGCGSRSQGHVHMVQMASEADSC